MIPTDALTDVEIAFLQVEFSIKLLSYSEIEKINPAEFDTDHVVLLDDENLNFPQGHFSGTDDIIRAAGVCVSASLGTSALVLDKAWEVAGIGPDPDSGDEPVKRSCAPWSTWSDAHILVAWRTRRGRCGAETIERSN